MALTDDERDALRDTARKFLDNRSASADVRALMEAETGFDRALWSEMAELGWLAIQVPEDQGGMGASYPDLAVVLHELGRHVTPGPFLASAVLGVEALLGADNATLRSDWLAPIVAGERIVTVASCSTSGSYEPARLDVRWHADGAGLRLDGEARFVPDAHISDAIVVSGRDDGGTVAMALVDRSAPGVTVAVEPTIDQTRRLARVRFDDVAVGADALLAEPGDLAPLQERLVSVGAVAVAADAVGAAEAMLERSVEYARERRQFDRPIGSFQAVKHHCANMLIGTEGSRAAVAHATRAFATGEDVHAAASVAASYAGPACVEVCRLGVLVHGGIGFTWEHDAHLYLKRTKLDNALFGSAAWHRRRLAGRVLLTQ